jgi:hypothetical protein
VIGFTTSTDFPTTAGALQPQHGGGSAGFPLDAFVLKLGPDGILGYATYLGDDVALGITVDVTGRAHVVGGTHSANFPVANAVQPRRGGGGFDLCGVGSCPRNTFVTRLNALGIVEYSTFLGGAPDTVANAIAIDDVNSVYVTGSTGGSFPITPVVSTPISAAVPQTPLWPGSTKMPHSHRRSTETALPTVVNAFPRPPGQ